MIVMEKNLEDFGILNPLGKKAVREFSTGATRNDDKEKLDYDGFLSPSALHEFALYMHSHRKQSDGNLRASDNWKKGISEEVYMKSLSRHYIDLWRLYKGEVVINPDNNLPSTKNELLCAILFNTQGLLHESLKK